VHLTASADGATVHTLCGRTIEAEDAAAVEVEETDCGLCLRRRDDPARVSAALFAEGRGAELLERSLREAPPRRLASPPLTVLRPEPEPEPEPEPDPEPEPVGELDTRGMRPFTEHVYVCPGGAIVRVSREAPRRLAQVSHSAGAELQRTPDGRLNLRLGDLVVEVAAEGGELRLTARLNR
jgi:hypothetical protein